MGKINIKFFFFCKTLIQPSQQTRNICITFIQRRPNVFDVGPILYKCYTYVLCLLGYHCLCNISPSTLLYKQVMMLPALVNCKFIFYCSHNTHTMMMIMVLMIITSIAPLSLKIEKCSKVHTTHATVKYQNGFQTELFN